MHLPVIRHHAQDDLLHVAWRRILAHFLQLLIQRRLGDMAVLQINYQPAVPVEKAIHGALLDLVPLAPHHDAVAIIVRFGAGNEIADYAAVKAADTLEEIAYLRFLDGLLGLVIDVLILAAAAGAEMFAAWLHAIGRSCQNL